MKSECIQLVLIIFLIVLTLGVSAEDVKSYCTESQRNVEVCPALYGPVCGWFDSSILCIMYPCATTYSNGCEACKNPYVSFWTGGECPKTNLPVCGNGICEEGENNIAECTPEQAKQGCLGMRARCIKDCEVNKCENDNDCRVLYDVEPINYKCDNGNLCPYLRKSSCVDNKCILKSSRVDLPCKQCKNGCSEDSDQCSEESKCKRDSDCPNDFLESFCQENSKCFKVAKYDCLKGECVKSYLSSKIKCVDCNNGCENGVCVNKEPICGNGICEDGEAERDVVCTLKEMEKGCIASGRGTCVEDCGGNKCNSDSDCRALTDVEPLNYKCEDGILCPYLRKSSCVNNKCILKLSRVNLPCKQCKNGCSDDSDQCLDEIKCNIDSDCPKKSTIYKCENNQECLFLKEYSCLESGICGESTIKLDSACIEKKCSESVCGNGICEEGEAESDGGCTPEQTEQGCLGGPARKGMCPKDCNKENKQETLVCRFKYSKETQKCYTEDNEFSCEGKNSCKINIDGNNGDNLIFVSSCRGSDNAVIDDKKDVLNFDCKEVGSGVSYRKGYYRCYDNSYLRIKEEFQSCMTRDEWYVQAEDYCEDKCDKSGKCGIKSFIVSSRCSEKKNEKVGTIENTDCSNSCILGDKCYPSGYRNSNEYCSKEKKFAEQKINGDLCENNFECKSNLCYRDSCINQGFISRLNVLIKKYFKIK